jgi:outer membrane autotransporter protein
MFRALPFPRRLLGALVVAITLGSPGAAFAQATAGLLFNQVFNVGGVGARGGADNGTGSVGCGGGTGGNLSTELNAALGGSSLDGNQSLANRRDLWRFCDNMTNVSFGPGGWTSQLITPTAEHDQNTGFAPADLFDQTNIAQALGRWYGQNIAIRIQTLRMAMREGGETPEVRIARERGRPTGVQTFQQMIEEQRAGSFDVEARRQAANARLMSEMRSFSMSSTRDFLGQEGLGYFANVRYHRLDGETTLDQRGGTTNGGGVTVGVDYRLSDTSFVGGAFGYTGFSTEFDFDLGSASTNDYSFMAFGSHFIDELLYVDGILRGSYTSFDQTRIVPAFDGGPAFAPRTSEPSGGSFSADVGLGMDWARDALRVNPYVRLRVTYTTFGAFTETGGDATLNLTVEDQSITSVPLTLGTTVSYDLSTPRGVISPYARIQYLHEFNEQMPFVEGYLAALPTARFALPPNTTDRDYLQVGAGATMAFARGWSGFVDYDALVAYTALTTHTVTLGIRRDL